MLTGTAISIYTMIVHPFATTVYIQLALASIRNQYDLENYSIHAEHMNIMCRSEFSKNMRTSLNCHQNTTRIRLSMNKQCIQEWYNNDWCFLGVMSFRLQAAQCYWPWANWIRASAPIMVSLCRAMSFVSCGANTASESSWPCDFSGASRWQQPSFSMSRSSERFVPDDRDFRCTLPASLK